jgi:hypothetical protein
MNPFTQHTQQQGVTYPQHLFFAAGIAWRLSSSVIAFAVHAIFPFIDIDKTLDLEATVNYLHERNDWIENTTLNEKENNAISHWPKKSAWLVLKSVFFVLLS